MRVRQWAVVGTAMAGLVLSGAGLASASTTAPDGKLTVYRDCGSPEDLTAVLNASGLKPSTDYELDLVSDQFTSVTVDFRTDGTGRAVFEYSTENDGARSDDVDVAWDVYLGEDDVLSGDYTAVACEGGSSGTPTTTPPTTHPTTTPPTTTHPTTTPPTTTHPTTPPTTTHPTTTAPTTTLPGQPTTTAPTTHSTTAPATTTTAASTTPAGAVAGTPTTPSASLAYTGAPVAGFALLGAALVAGGGAALVMARRRAG